MSIIVIANILIGKRDTQQKFKIIILNLCCVSGAHDIKVYFSWRSVSAMVMISPTVWQ